MARGTFGLVASLAAGLWLAGEGARAEMMATCAPEIARFCSDVSRGRGRVTACLAGQREAIGPACLAEVEAATRAPGVPKSAGKVLDPGAGAPLPRSCEGAAARVCPGVPEGDARVFACLYAHSDRVSQICISDARKALRSAR